MLEKESKTTAEKPRLFRPDEVARILDISRWTVYGWINQGRIRSVKIGRLVRIPESELDRLTDEGQS